MNFENGRLRFEWCTAIHLIPMLIGKPCILHCLDVGAGEASILAAAAGHQVELQL